MILKPGVLLRLEGAVVFALSLMFYPSTGASCWFFGLIFLWPDLFMLGYLMHVRLGSKLYNLVHTYLFPLVLAAVSLRLHNASCLSFALIWIAHIGFDRALGFGLKYPTFFKDTHLQRVDESAESTAARAAVNG